MGFWELKQPGCQPAAIDARSGEVWTYERLAQDVARAQEALPQVGRKPLGLLLAENRYECLVTYLAALNSGSPLLLLDATLNPGLLAGLVENYRPDWIYSLRAGSGFPAYQPSSVGGLFERKETEQTEIHP